MRNVSLISRLRIVLLIFLFLGHAHSQTLSTSLTACYAFDNSGAEPISNLTATLGVVTSTVNRFNNPNSAYYFNGTNAGIIRMPGSSLLKPTNEISVAAWIKPTILPSGVGCYVLFTKNSSSVNFEAYAITINNIGGGVSKFAALKGSGGASSVCLSTTSIVPNTWYHVAMSIDNSTIKIYINGVLENTISTSLSFNYDTNHDVYFGGTNESYNLPFTGVIDNAKFYNRVLSASEVSQLYMLDPNCTFTPGQAVNFDGVNDYVDPNILITNVSNNFTYEMWARPTATHEIDAQTTSTSNIAGLSNQRYLVWPVWRNLEGGIGISAGTNGISVYEHGSNFINSLLTYTGSFSAWTHIAVVVTNKTPALYINGSLVQTGLTSTHSNVWPSLGEVGQYGPLVGGIGGGSYGYYEGDVDEFRLWNSAISQTQIATYMSSEFTCPMPGLLAYYKFNSGLAFSNNSTFTTVADNSGSNYTATLTSMALNGNTSNWIAPGPTLTPVANFSMTVSASSATICPSQSTTLTASGASTYTWLPGNSNGPTLVTSPSVTTTYTVIGISSGTCSSTKTITIVVQTPSLNISATPSVICIGNTSNLTAFGVVSCTWQPGAISGTMITVSPTATTLYSASATYSSGCTASSNVVVIVNPSIPITAIASSSAICVGATATLSAFGATSYTWQPGNLSAQSITVSPNATTIYTVTGSNILGCASSVTLSVNVLSPPTITAMANPSVVCPGGTATLTAGGATSYTWLPLNFTGSSVVVSPTTATQYTIIGSANGCTASTSLLLYTAINPNISASSSPSTVCPGDPSTLTATGASNYTWQPGNLNGASVVVNPLTATIYTVTGTSGGCSATATTQVNMGIALNISASGNLCNNASITLSVSPTSSATTVLWSGPGIISAATNPLISVNVGGIYTVVVTNTVSNCSGTETINVFSSSNPFSLSIVPSSTVACYPGPPVNLLVSASASLSWFPATEVSPNTGPLVSVSPTVTSSYTVIGTLGSCSSSAAITISVNQTPTVSLSGTQFSVCSLSSVSVVATGASEYNWVPGNLSGDTVSLVPYSSGIFTVTGANGFCTDTKTLFVTVLPTPSLAVQAIPATICIGNTSSLTVSGALSYTWHSTVTSSVGPMYVVNPTVTTVYSVTGLNSSQCSSTSTLQLNVINSPAIGVSASDTEICVGESVTLTASGASTYTWMPGFLIGNTIVTTPSTSVVYTVNSTNATCSYATILITVNTCVNNSLGISNAASEPVAFRSNYYKIKMTITAGNSSNSDLSQVSLTDDLRSTFPYPCSYTLSSKPKITSINSLLKINPNYDGKIETELTLLSNSSLAANKRDTINFEILLEPDGYYGISKNSVLGTALDKNNILASDSSNNGFDLDPDNDGNPTNNNLITYIDIRPLELFIPEGFSPNGDGKNDYFVIGGLNGKSVNIEVFNRWGNQVYANRNYNNDWDGTSQAKGTLGKGKLPQGTYYYILEFPEGNRASISGYVVIEY